MSQDESPQERARLQREADRAKPKPRLSVMSYITVLFAVAFLLLLLSYLMQQRNTEEVISGLKASVSAMQSIDSLQAENQDLTQQVDLLEEQAAEQAQAQQQDRAEAQETIALQRAQLQAMDWLREIQALYAKKYYKAARAMIADFEASGSPQYLPAESLHSYDGQEAPSPAEQYAQIVEALS